MARLGSDGGFQADNRGGIIDDQGNTVVSASTSFGDAPLGYGPLTQVTTGFPNGLMSLPPQDASAPIVDNANEMPGWSVQELSDERIVTEWIELSPAQSLNIKNAIDAARSSVIGGSGPSGGTATTYSGRGALQITLADADIGDQLVLSAEAPYVSAIGAGITTAFVMSFEGTTTVIAGVEIVQEIYAVDDDGDATIIYYNSAVAGDNTSGWGFKQVIPDTTTKLTATITIDIVGAVVSSAPLLISSVTAYPADGDALRSSLITAPGDLIAGYEVSSIAGTYTDVTSIPIGTAGQVLTVDLTEDARMKWATPSGGGGGGGSVIIETFTASGTWTRPAGVDYLVAVIGVGGGGGGATGKYELTRSSQTPPSVDGGGGGGGSRYLCVQNLYVGDVGSVSVGIGAGGIGASAESFTKVAGSTNTANSGGGGGAAGGTTTFGTYFSIPGGGGAIGTPSATVGNGGTAGGTVTCSIYGFIELLADDGASEPGNNAGTPQPGIYSQLPYTPAPGSAGANGAAGTAAGGTGTAFLGAAGLGGSAWYSGGGGGGGRTSSTSSLRNGGKGASGGGGGGGAAARQIVGTATITATAGSGGAGATGSGGGGGGGGGAVIYAPLTAVGTTSYRDSTLTATTGAGGNGGAGAVIIVYIG